MSTAAVEAAVTATMSVPSMMPVSTVMTRANDWPWSTYDNNAWTVTVSVIRSITIRWPAGSLSVDNSPRWSRMTKSHVDYK